MRLASIHIQNFRSFADQTIELSPYCCFAGPNGSGKSTVLNALNVFFRHSTNPLAEVGSLAEEDFHLKNTAEPIRITLTFSELSDEAAGDLKDYVRQGKLVVTAKAEWDPASGVAEVIQHGQRLGMKSFAGFFERAASDAKVPELRELYSTLRDTYPTLPPSGSKQAMIDALHEFEAANPALCELLESRDEFYGFTRGANRLAKYLQWVHVPAVKDAYEEQAEAKNTALGQLLARTIRAKVNFTEELGDLKKQAAERYLGMMENQKEALSVVSQSLERRLHEWAHGGARLNLEWHYDPRKSITVSEPMAWATLGEDEFSGEIVRLGHGLQRAFIVSLLQELAGCDEPEGPRLLLGFEEPELYQHPPQARYLASLLAELAAGNTQIVVTTHSPYFISTRQFESLRLVRKSGPHGQSIVKASSSAEVTGRLAAAMERQPWPAASVMASLEAILQPSQAELFFCSCAVLVEGLEDLAFITSQAQLDGHLGELRRCGCHFVVADGKPNMGRLITLANVFEIPILVVCDSDANDTDHVGDHRRHNIAIQRLLGRPKPEAFPAETFWSDNLVMWPKTIGCTVRGEVGPDTWANAVEVVRARLGLIADLSKKNGTIIASAVEQLNADGVRPPSLERLSQLILDFARATRSGSTGEGGGH